VTFTFDTVCTACYVDVTNQWGGVTLLLDAHQSVHIVALDWWGNRLRYHGCANVCDDAAHWFGGTGDTIPYPYGFFEWSSAVLTPGGIDVVYTDCPTTQACNGVRYAHCAGACYLRRGWTEVSLFPGRADLSSGWGCCQSTSLAADSMGGLHLLFADPRSRSLRYAYCGANCGNQVSWQEVRLDTLEGPPLWPVRLIAFDPRSGVHALYVTSAGLIHASCAASCTSAASWQSEVVATDLGEASEVGLSLAFGPDGRLHLAYRDHVGTAKYATCATPCAALGGWSVVGLPLRTSDVAVTTDRTGSVYLATTYRTVALSRCAANCLDPASWQTTLVDSAQGGGHVSIAVDSAGHARIASTTAGNLLQYTQMRQ